MKYLLLILYIIAIFLRPQEWFPGFTNFPIVDVLVVLTVLLIIAELNTSRLKIPALPENLFMLGFFLAALMSQVANTYLQGLIDTFTVLGKFVVIFFFIIILTDSLRKIRILTAIIIGCVSIMVFNGLWQYYHGVGFLVGSRPIYENFYGVQTLARIVGFGIFEDPNDFALLLVTTIPFILDYMFIGKGLARIVFPLSLTACFIWAVWLTNSRGGIVVFIITMLVFLQRRWRGLKFLLFIMLFLILVTPFLPSRFAEKGMLDASSRERLIFWGVGNDVFKKNPIFGVGFSMFPMYCADRSAHNSYIECYAELGLFGYFFWIGLIFLTLYGLLTFEKYCKKHNQPLSKEVLSLADAFTAAIVGYLVSGMTLTRTYIISFYILLALAVKLRYITTDGKYLTGYVFYRKQIIGIVISIIASIFFIYGLTRYLNTKI